LAASAFKFDKSINDSLMSLYNLRLLMLLFIGLNLASVCFGQIAKQDATKSNAIDSTINALRKNESLGAPMKSHLADSIFLLCQRLHLPCQQLKSRIIQSYYLDELGLADSALQQLMWVNANFNVQCGPYLRWWLYSGLTNIYLTLGEYKKVDSLTSLTQSDWLASHSEHDIYFSILTNGAIALASEGKSEEAQQLFYHVLAETKRVKDDKYELKTLINLASVMGMMEKFDSANYYLGLAAIKARHNDDNDAFINLQISLAIMDFQEGRFDLAESRLDSAEILATQFKNLEKRASVLYNRASLAELQNRYKDAYVYIHDYLILHDSILDQSRIKSVTEMQEKYESEKKARQIQQLEIENLDANLQNEKIRHTRNRMIYIGGGILLFAIGLWTRLRLVHRSRRAIQQEKDISEGLLLNILPAAVAEELKAKGAAEAKLYEQATILFSDFKSFTEVAGEMSAAELVNEINVCFKAFDEIMGQFGLEKIKTIGDSYMAAGAVPDDNKAEAIHVVQAALAMQDFIAARKQVRDDANQLAFEMRVGIHTGPVVAGIVGIKKFQYDLWGDTVNIASRMETNSEPGHVNISATTYELVRHEPALTFTPRGMIQVKGKGEMAMYFVKRA
jgi:adenylate cyclase